MAFKKLRAARREKTMRRLADVGVRAPAVITHVSETGRRVEGHPVVEITYAVAPDGAPGFDITKVTPVSITAVPTPGLAALAVFDPAHPADNVVFDGPASSREIEVAFDRTFGSRH